jgi:PST family polysaccharide transporter
MVDGTPLSERPAPPPRSALTIGVAAALGLISSLSNLVFSIVRSKVAAVRLGPIGLGKSAEILQLVTLANTPANLILGAPVVSGIAEAQRLDDRDAVHDIVFTARLVVLGACTAAAIVSVIGGRWLLPASWGPSAWPLTLLASVAAVLTALTSLSQQILTAFTALRQLTLVTLAIGTLSAILVCIGTWWWSLEGLFAATALAGVGGLVMAQLAARHVLPPRAQRPRFDRRFLARATAVGITALIGSGGQQSALFVIRWTLEQHGGPAANGQFQAAWAIGSTYFGLVLTSLGNFVFPRYAAAQSVEELTSEVRAAGRFVLQVAPPVILIAISLRRVAVHLLYNHRFDDAIDLVGLQMVGDVAKAMAWSYAGPILYRNRIRAFLATEVFGAAGLSIASIVLIPRFGLLGAGYAYLVIYFAYALFTAWMLRTSCSVPIDMRALTLMTGSTLLALATFLLGQRLRYVEWPVIAAALYWWHRTGVLGQVSARVRRYFEKFRRSS